MSTPQTCELWEPNRLEFRFQLEDLLHTKRQKSFTQLHATAHYQPSCEVCDVTASVVGFVSPLWVVHLWCIVSDQYLKNDDHIYQVTRLTHQDGMLRPVKMLIFLRTLGCCFLNLGSEASTSSDLSLPLAFWPKTPLKFTQHQDTPPNMPWPFPWTPTPAKPLHHLNARHWRWAFSALAFPQPLRGSPSGKVILLALETWHKHGRFSSFLSWPKGYCHQSLSFTLNPGKRKEVSEVLAY